MREGRSIDMKEKYRWLENITDKKRLTENLSFVGVFIAYVERMQHTTSKNLISFFMDYGTYIIDQPIKESTAFKEDVLSLCSKRYDAIFQWFVNQGAIVANDLIIIKKARVRRNELAHNIDHFLFSGPSKEDVELLAELVRIYTTIDQWWINEIEIPTSPDNVPEEYSPENVFSIESLILQIIFEIATDQQTFDYQEILNSIKHGNAVYEE